jgi:glycosyltransferase involved in cell wall biosynthesis
VFAVSEEMASVLRDRSVGRGKVEVLPIGIPTPAVARTRAAVRSELGVTDDAPVVVTVARLARQKCLDVMLDAIERLPGVALWIVGDGPLRQELEQQATDLGIVERVRFLGQQAEVGDYLSAADVFALSSSWEARALAAQEAIQLHVPVVTTDVGGMGELIEDRVSGRTVPPGDPGAFAAALGQALEDPAGARRRADVAFNRLSLGSSTEAMLDRLVAEYRRSDPDV